MGSGYSRDNIIIVGYLELLPFTFTTMSLVLAPIVELYRWGLQPVALFSWFGLQISIIDLAAAVRLCLVLRQVRQLIAKDYKAQAAQVAAGASEKEKAAVTFVGPKFEEKSLVRDLVATLIVVHGGDAIGKFNYKGAHALCSTRLADALSSTSAPPRRASLFLGFGRLSSHVCTDSNGDRVDSFGPGLVPPARTSFVVLGRAE